VFFGVFIAAFMARVLEKRVTAMAGISLIGLCQFFPAILMVSGLIPPPAVVPALMTAAALSGVGASMSLIGFQSMMADAADEHELLFGARREGFYFAGLSFSAKAASGLGTFIAGLALGIIDFPADLASKGGDKVHIAAATVEHLGLMYGIVPGAMTFICIVLTVFYRIDRAAHADIQTQLVARRAAKDGVQI